MKLRFAVIALVICVSPVLSAVEQSYRIVFGSFQQQLNAEKWAQNISTLKLCQVL